MAKNERVSEETFGGAIPAPKMVGGKIAIFGHTVKEGAAIPDRGTSVNQKTGFPAKPVK